MQSRRPAGLVTRSKSLLIRIPASDPARSESFDIFFKGARRICVELFERQKTVRLPGDTKSSNGF